MPTRQKTIGQMPPGTKINELFVNLPARQISISSNCNFPFHQLAPFHQLSISSLFHQLVISVTTNLSLHHL
jgi:hypothetical protein